MIVQHLNLILESLCAEDFRIKDINIVEFISKSASNEELKQELIKSAIILRWICDSLTVAGETHLDLHRKDFEFKYPEGTVKDHDLCILFPVLWCWTHQHVLRWISSKSASRIFACRIIGKRLWKSWTPCKSSVIILSIRMTRWHVMIIFWSLPLSLVIAKS